MEPTLIGYFPKLTARRGESLSIGAPAVVEDVCNVACASPEPDDWINLWLHNDLWVYDTEARAWAVGTQSENLRRLCAQLRKSWDGKPGSIELAVDQFISLHVPSCGDGSTGEGVGSRWEVFAYRLFPERRANGNRETYVIPKLKIQPLPVDYEALGFDVVSREYENEFSHSPLSPFCNGKCSDTQVNRHCLLDNLETAFQLACHWSKGEYQANVSYLGPAEPGPYFVVEVFRKRI